MYDPILGGALLPLRKVIASALSKNKHANILDLCCGTAAQLRFLEKDGYINLHGLDLDPAAIAYAKKCSHTIELHKEDASNTPFDDQSFDAIIISLALHDKNQTLRNAILNEIARLLKPNAYALIADFSFDDKSTKWGRFLISAVEFFAGGEHYANFKEYTARGEIPKLIPNNIFTIKELGRAVNNSIAVWKLSQK